MLIKVLLLVVFFAVMIGVGIACRKSARDVNGFVLGGRSVGPWLTAFAYGTSYFSAVIFVGYAGQFGWKFGIASTWIGIGNAIIGSLLAWLILGKRTRLMSQHLKSATMPEFFGLRFGSKWLKIAASVITFVFLIPYTASLYNGLSRLFEMAFGVDYAICVLVMAFFTGIYVVIGGYVATAVNDFIQGIVMIFGIILVVLAVLKTQGGFTAALEGLASIPLADGSTGAFASVFGPDPLTLAIVVLLTSLGTWGLPQMVQKFYAIKDQSAIKKGTVVSTVFATIVAGGCYFLGGFGRLFSDKVDIDVSGAVKYDSIVPTMLSGLSDILIGIVVILVLSASMSTLSSLVLTSSSTITLDFISPLAKKPLEEKKKLSCMRMFIVLFIVISAVIAIVQARSSVTFIAQLMGISWGALAGAFLAPFLCGLYWKKTTAAAVAVNFAFGITVMLLNILCPSIFPQMLRSPLSAGVFTMLVGLVLVPAVSLFTKKPDKLFVEDAFSCFKK